MLYLKQVNFTLFSEKNSKNHNQQEFINITHYMYLQL